MNEEGDHQSLIDLFDLLNTRSEYLSRLDTEACEKRELVDDLSVSRSTVDRVLRELITAGLVQQSNGQYQLTFYGRTALAVYNSVLAMLEDVQRAQPLLVHLPPDISFDVGLLLNGEVLVAEEPALHLPAARVRELVQQATEIKALAYAHTSPEAARVFLKQIRADNLKGEIVFRKPMYTHLRDSHPQLHTLLSESPSFAVSVIEELPFGLFLLRTPDEWQVCLLVYGPEQNLRGLIVNDEPRAVAWARQLFDQYQTDATPLADF
ncbi:helix-turn-helix transcriptional regulator [Halorussus salinus]|uniref:helix-turn-helix transcriptional regulator n=1 Tax=Halorussus salinus TaxID=1364935 RepID=UPI001092C720|nr:GntR family transcriptional regulator [Halorussus salinus]